MTWILITYGIVMLGIGLLDAGKVKTFDSYVLAGRERSARMVGTSILASVVGASATLGVADLAYQVGFPAFWWLGSGALGLFLCGLLVAGKIRDLGVCTLADLVQSMIGPYARRVVSLVIVIGWTGIIAAQFVAAAKIVASITSWEYSLALGVSGACITAYCLLGGQLSVLKTDAIQLCLMLAGLAVTLWVLFGRTGLPDAGIQLQLLNDSFGIDRFWYFLLVVGSGFIIGPDIFSRLFTARDSGTARWSAFMAGSLLLLVSAGIVAIGIWARYYVAIPEGLSVLPWILEHEVPAWLGALLSFGLLSAIVSSSDTCLISAAAIAEHDLLMGSKVWRTRVIILSLGLMSVIIAGLEADIIGTLLLAYSLFNCGVIPPVLTAVLAWPCRRLHEGITVAAILAGGSLGIAGRILGMDGVTMTGMGVSILLSLAAVKRNIKA
ncbi:MAG: sodium:solute symporter family protein [Acidobacteriota bacterium]